MLPTRRDLEDEDYPEREAQSCVTEEVSAQTIESRNESSKGRNKDLRRR